jgi:hypothetical protein
MRRVLYIQVFEFTVNYDDCVQHLGRFAPSIAAKSTINRAADLREEVQS